MDLVRGTARGAGPRPVTPAAFATPRTRLRLLLPEDEALYCALYTDPAVMALVGPPMACPAARSGFHAACRLNAVAGGRQRRWAVLDRASGAGVGLLAVLRDRGDGRGAEVGIMLLPAAQGRGLARELNDAVAALAFGAAGWGMDRLWARHLPGHGAAAAVLAATGFAPGPAIGTSATVVQRRSDWLARHA